jgi:hypothetical protein
MSPAPRPGPIRQYVFAYGSLAVGPGPALTRHRGPGGFVADLRGYARQWGVAMDNRRDLPGYKYYTDEAGRRPAVFVTFLDVRPSPSAVSNGVCRPVDARRLEILDHRERNYARVDVSDHVLGGGARIWTYVGSPDGRERLARGVAAGRAVIHDAYLRQVTGAFTALGADEYEACRRSLCPGPLPVRSLTRHELP